ncbi:MAG: hypothetical protein HQL89_09010 [Magnetococcales bacterium]|nr:hypothetical protein [Magnetococcales bacterium]
MSNFLLHESGSPIYSGSMKTDRTLHRHIHTALAVITSMLASDFVSRKPSRLKNRKEQRLHHLTEIWMMIGKTSGIGSLVTIPIANSCPWFIQLFIGWFFVTLLLMCLGPLLRFFMTGSLP